LVFQNCFVTNDHVLGEEGKGLNHSNAI
jgi:alkylation response protein AidB-like acyl-CoA dehydrogenase